MNINPYESGNEIVRAELVEPKRKRSVGCQAVMVVAAVLVWIVAVWAWLLTATNMSLPPN